MSKILASIADAERFSNLQTIDGFYKSSNEIKQRATAARAEHAEIVAAWAVLSSLSREDMTCKDEGCECREAFARLDSLLSRVGGGA